MRPDLTVIGVKALMVACQAVYGLQGYGEGVTERVTDIVFDGIRPR